MELFFLCNFQPQLKCCKNKSFGYTFQFLNGIGKIFRCNDLNFIAGVCGCMYFKYFCDFSCSLLLTKLHNFVEALGTSKKRIFFCNNFESNFLVKVVQYFKS